ncbi:MAG: hypothetical protein ABW124_04785, partial [Candidatus Thiodiazotropha sp. 6PLUC9]
SNEGFESNPLSPPNKKGEGLLGLGVCCLSGLIRFAHPLRGACAALRRLRHCVPFERRVRINPLSPPNKKSEGLLGLGV